MAKVQTGGIKRLEPLRPTFEHKTMQEATISEVSDIYEQDSYEGDEKVEKLTLTVRASVEDDLDIDDETRDALLEYIHSRNLDRIKDHLKVSGDEAEELVEEVRENNLDKAEAAGDDVDMFSYNYVELPYFCTAKLTRSSGSQSNSNLYNQLDQLGLAEPYSDDKFELLDRHGEVVESQKEDVHEIFGDAETNDEINEALVGYLRDNLIGAKVQFQVKNANRGKDNEYSIVGDMIKKVADPEAE